MTGYFKSKCAGKLEWLNYVQWANRMRAHFIATGRLRIVLGEEVCPPDADGNGRTYKTWLEKDGKA